MTVIAAEKVESFWTDPPDHMLSREPVPEDATHRQVFDLISDDAP
jgi:hypothetical protein